MQINPVSSVVGQYTAIKTVTAPEKKVGAGQVDKTELSADAKLFTQAFAAAKKGVDSAHGSDYAARVKDVAKRVEAGNYEVSDEELASKLMLLV